MIRRVCVRAQDSRLIGRQNLEGCVTVFADLVRASSACARVGSQASALVELSPGQRHDQYEPAKTTRT